jgi:hypothetical protein
MKFAMSLDMGSVQPIVKDHRLYDMAKRVIARPEHSIVG